MLQKTDINAYLDQVLTLDNLISWLETKHPAETYEMADSKICMLAQWLKTIDVDAVSTLGGDSFTYTVLGKPYHMPRHFGKVVFSAYDIGGNTFGDALKRARIANGQ